MSLGGAVDVQVRFTKEAIAALPGLTEEAVQRALMATIADMRTFALAGAGVPVDTGKLKGSFDIARTPRSIVFQWSAKSPKGYDYAEIQDEGGLTGTGGVIIPKDFSSKMRDYAHERLVFHLLAELQLMLSGATNLQGALVP